MEVDEPASGRKVPPGFAFLFLLLTFIWFASNSSTAIAAILTGAAIAATLAYIFAPQNAVWRDLRISPRRLYHFMLYMGVFIVEIVRPTSICCAMSIRRASISRQASSRSRPR